MTAVMATKKEGRPASRKEGTGRGKRGQMEPGTGKEAGQEASMPVVDLDPWGMLLEKLLEEPAEAEAAEQPGSGKRKPGRGPGCGSRP